MKKRNVLGYETCAHSTKRKQASWRVHDTCPNPARLFTGRHYLLPNTSVCYTCRYYCRDKSITGKEAENGKRRN